jgi:hypothetical protein
MLTQAEQEQLKLLMITIGRLRIENPEVLRKKDKLWVKSSLEERVKLYREVFMVDETGQELIH